MSHIFDDVDIILEEGLWYLDNMLEQSGVIISKRDEIDCYAIHTEKKWLEIKQGVLDKVDYRYLIHDFKLLKTTRLKDGRYNHIFKIIR